MFSICFTLLFFSSRYYLRLFVLFLFFIFVLFFYVSCFPLYVRIQILLSAMLSHISRLLSVCVFDLRVVYCCQLSLETISSSLVRSLSHTQFLPAHSLTQIWIYVVSSGKTSGGAYSGFLVIQAAIWVEFEPLGAFTNMSI